MISLCRRGPEHDANGEPLLQRKVVERGERWEDGEVRREADWRIPAPVGSPPYGTCASLAKMSQNKKAAVTNCAPSLGPH